MNIAVTSDGENIHSIVSLEFEKCRSLIIIDVDNMSIRAVIGNAEQNGTKIAREVIQYGCEALITGKMQSEAFNILADAYITRYEGAGSTVEEAIKLMENNSLKIIKSAEGEQGCGGHHH
jgi:predicted Fe-Mo cluster-binding NifX family protein